MSRGGGAPVNGGGSAWADPPDCNQVPCLEVVTENSECETGTPKAGLGSLNTL